MKLGRITKIELRSQWKSESSDFTPWLAGDENIKLLSDAIGIDLEVQKQEERVGPFRADILCKDTISGNYVLIENQLEKTDHIHLGQLMTYAAGLNAVNIVWIAQKFTEEHRAALDWLNENTTEGLNFFGIEIELIKIDASLPAPIFNVISQPNDWSKTVKRTAQNNNGSFTETKLLQQEYWQCLKDLMEKNNSVLKNQKPSPQHWTSFAVGKSNFHISAGINTREDKISASLVIAGTNAKANYKKVYDLYFNDAQKILGKDFIWDDLPDAKQTSIVYIELKNAILKDKSDWNNQHEWLKVNLEKLYNYFNPKLKQL
jgi:hypothetical protein